VQAYYTTQWFKKRYRGERFVYHLVRYCPSGRRIKRQHRTRAEAPVDGRRPCRECTALAVEWLALPTVQRSTL
jgi:hypothetical protein